MAYNISTDLEEGDPAHVEHHIAMAAAINDLDARVTAGSVSGQTPMLRTSGGYVQTKLPSELAWTNLFQIPTGTGGGTGAVLDGGTP